MIDPLWCFQNSNMRTLSFLTPTPLSHALLGIVCHPWAFHWIIVWRCWRHLKCQAVILFVCPSGFRFASAMSIRGNILCNSSNTEYFFWVILISMNDAYFITLNIHSRMPNPYLMRRKRIHLMMILVRFVHDTFCQLSSLSRNFHAYT